jgi:peptidoglycan/LPS O-acetylase OafA/YrhL
VALSLGTDQVLHVLGVYPPWGQTMSDGLFLLATGYRIVYTIIGSYVAARLAPYRPMWHAMVLGVVGLVVSIAGAAATWNHEPPLGPHWYAVAVALISIPCAWIGGKIWETQSGQT